MLPSEFWGLSLSEVAEFIEAQGEADWLKAWRRAQLNAFAFADPGKMPSAAELLGEEKKPETPQTMSQEQIIAAMRAMVTKR